MPKYSCAICGAELVNEQWVRSSFTKNRYCLPGEGCFVTRRDDFVTAKTTFENPQSGEEGENTQRTVGKAPARTPSTEAVLQDLSQPFLPLLET